MDEPTLDEIRKVRSKTRRVRALVACWLEDCILRQPGDEFDYAGPDRPEVLEDVPSKPAKKSADKDS